MQVPPASVNLGHDVRGAKVVRTWAEGSRVTVSVLYQPPECIRLCRPLPSLANTRPLRSATTDYGGYPPVPRWDESLYQE